MATSNLSLLGSLSRIEAPIIKVQIGEHVFGVYTKNGNRIEYPNYVTSIQVKKINGKVNTYSLVLTFPITEHDDPNFMDKVFSSVSNTRKIIFSYGDSSMPSYMYKNEVAIINGIQQKMNIQTSVITYTVNAVSSAYLANAGVFTFRERFDKPSNVIKEVLYTEYYGLLELFSGMRDKGLVEMQNLIPQDDEPVKIEMKSNISVLDYLSYLVTIMTPYKSGGDSIRKSGLYVLTIVDFIEDMVKDEANTYIFNGPYFKIIRNIKNQDTLDTYTIDIGFPSQNIVTSFEIDNNENYSILYNYSERTQPSDYVLRIADNGEVERVYAPVLSSNNDRYRTREADKSWWTNITQYPIKVTIGLKGLLRPAILMSYVRINTYYFGNKYAAGSGLYIVTSQTDTVDANGYRTVLTLSRVGGDTYEEGD